MIFLLPVEMFSEKYQVMKSNPNEKSFITVILCYCIDASLPNRR